MNIEIHSFKKEHLQEVLTLHSNNYEGWGVKGLVNDIANPNTESYVAIIDKEIVGFCSYLVGDDAQLNYVCTKKTKHRLGIASNLLSSTISNLDVDSIVLEVRSQNISAISLYEKLNFKKLGVRKNLYSFPSDDGIVMEYTKKEKFIW